MSLQNLTINTDVLALCIRNLAVKYDIEVQDRGNRNQPIDTRAFSQNDFSALGTFLALLQDRLGWDRRPQDLSLFYPERFKLDDLKQAYQNSCIEAAAFSVFGLSMLPVQIQKDFVAGRMGIILGEVDSAMIEKHLNTIRDSLIKRP